MEINHVQRRFDKRLLILLEMLCYYVQMKGSLYNDKKVCRWRSRSIHIEEVSLGAVVSVYKGEEKGGCQRERPVGISAASPW